MFFFLFVTRENAESKRNMTGPQKYRNVNSFFFCCCCICLMLNLWLNLIRNRHKPIIETYILSCFSYFTATHSIGFYVVAHILSMLYKIEGEKNQISNDCNCDDNDTLVSLLSIITGLFCLKVVSIAMIFSTTAATAMELRRKTNSKALIFF